MYGERILGRGKSLCKGPEVGAWQLCLKNMERTSMARAEAIWGRAVDITLLLVMSYNPVRYHRCALTEHFQHTLRYSTLRFPGIFHQSLQRLEAGWCFQRRREGASRFPLLSTSAGGTCRVNRGREGPVGSRKTSALSLHWCCPQATWQPAQQQLCRPLPSFISVALSVSSLLEPKEKLCIILQFSS